MMCEQTIGDQKTAATGSWRLATGDRLPAAFLFPWSPASQSRSPLVPQSPSFSFPCSLGLCFSGHCSITANHYFPTRKIPTIRNQAEKGTREQGTEEATKRTRARSRSEKAKRTNSEKNQFTDHSSRFTFTAPRLFALSVPQSLSLEVPVFTPPPHTCSVKL